MSESQEQDKQLTYSEKRRAETRSSRYIPMEQISKLAAIREENKKPIADPYKAKVSDGVQKGKMLTACLNAYIAGDTEKFERYSDITQAIVKKLVESSKNDGNLQATGMIFERVDGKVKEEIDMTTRSQDLAPDQEEKREFDEKFSNKDYKAIDSNETGSQAAQIERDEALPDFQEGKFQ